MAKKKKKKNWRIHLKKLGNNSKSNQNTREENKDKMHKQWNRKRINNRGLNRTKLSSLKRLRKKIFLNNKTDQEKMKLPNQEF